MFCARLNAEPNREIWLWDVYEMKVLAGKVRREVVVDAVTGEVLSDRAEDE